MQGHCDQGGQGEHGRDSGSDKMTIFLPYTEEDSFMELMKDEMFRKLVETFELELDFRK